VPGEFLVETVDRKAPAKSGIRLEDVRPKPGRTRVYEILYAVVEAGKDLPVKQGVYEYDAAIPVPAALAGRVRMPGEAAPTGPGGAEAPGTSAERREPGLAGGGPAVAPAAPAAGPAADLKPEVTWRNLDNADVAFDQGTYDYFRSADAQALAESVKTQEATDASGRVIGLKITGISQGTPADKFDVKPGDILVSINDQPVQSRSDAINVAQRIDPNADRVKVVIDRNGRQITYAIDPRDPKTRRAAATLDRGSR
jgi:membrane-associated protease RseP (regulator of RpoE activity)